MNNPIAFIGGGNMASAIIGGLIRNGQPAHLVWVVEPDAAQRARLQRDFKVHAMEQAKPDLSQADLVVWAVKPQLFKDAAMPVQPFTRAALHLSVAAGIPSDSIVRWLDSERVVRAMPNTPALIGKGVTALFARPAVNIDERRTVDAIIGTTGELLWVDAETQLDAVTALSGSGPAYVFYFIEAMTQAGADMGLPREQAHHLAVATFLGSAELARSTNEPPELLRQRVTSKGGTTYAAIAAMEHSEVKAHFMQAMHAAQHRAQEMGEEFGRL